MSNRELYLLGSRRFLPLFVTQFLGAFNDNLFKNALVILITYRLAVDSVFSVPQMVNIAAGVFILPFFLFSAIAGQLAERSEKSGLIRKVKLFEIMLALFATLALFSGDVYFMLGILFMLGTQSTFFGPLKYSILPDHLREDELIGGNGLISMGTFVSILIGIMAGTLLILTEPGYWLVSGLMLAVALAGWLASLYIPVSAPATPDLKLNWNIFTGTWRMLKHSAGNLSVFRATLGISWFWLLGATYLAQFSNYANTVIGGNEQVVALFLTAFTLGVGLGSLLCNRLVQGEVTAKYVPLAALGMTFFAVDLYFASQAIVPDPQRLIGAAEFFGAFQHWRVFLDFVLFAACGGVYIVPLYSIIQNRSKPEHRSRNIASLNVMNALFMVVSALGTTALLGAGYSIPEIFLILAVLNAGVALYICKLLPHEVVKVLMRRLLFLLYKVEITGLEHYRKAGDRVVIVVNHISFLDGLLLGAYLPDIPTAAMNTHIARRWWVKPALALFDIVTVDPTNPISVKTMIKVVKGGNKLIIFPEGRITVTGALMKVYEGPGTIAHLADATLVPIRIDGAQYSPFSRLRGKLPTRWFPKITLTVMPPRRFHVPEGVRGRQRRQIIGNQLYDLMVEMVFITSDLRQTLFAGLLRAEKLFGMGRGILEDVERAPVRYARLLASSLVLGRRFKQFSA
ncbi:MAG TPA: 1-acyl-sn-glycerol-3-phosphate acyltransferase, partial [Gammaproteobacteria bacterium]